MFTTNMPVMEITTVNKDPTENLILDGINVTIQKTCGLS